ncbi:hypothetical protein [Acetivibrio clariflavus]
MSQGYNVLFTTINHML